MKKARQNGFDKTYQPFHSLVLPADALVPFLYLTYFTTVLFTGGAEGVYKADWDKLGYLKR